MKWLCCMGILLLFATSATAQERESLDKLISEGARQLGEADWPGAERSFLKALAYSPGHPDLTALLGVARFHQGKYELSAGDFESALAGGTKYKSRVLYYLSLAHATLGHEEQGKEYARRLLTEFPASREAQMIKSGAQKRSPAPGKDAAKLDRWEVVLIQDICSDSNAPRVAHGDSDTLLFSFLSVKFKARPLPLNIRASFFWRNFSDQNELDFMGVQGALEGELKLSRGDTFLPAVSLQTLWLDEEKYQGKFGYELLWKRDWGRRWFTDLDLKHGSSEHTQVEYESLDSEQSSGRFRLWYDCLQFKPLTRVRLLGAFLRETMDDDYLSYDSWTAGIEMRFSFPWRVSAEVKAGYSERRYLDDNPAYSLRREDERTTVDICVLRPVSRWLFLRLTASWLTSRSNVERYTYSEAVYGIGLLLMF